MWYNSIATIFGCAELVIDRVEKIATRSALVEIFVSATGAGD